MHRSRLVTGLAGAFALMTVVLVVGGLAGSLILLPVAALFAAMTYILWSHASGRLMGRLYRSVEDQARTAGAAAGGRQRARSGQQQEGRERGGFGAGPREEWTAPREGRSVTEEARRRARQQARARQGRAADGGRGQRRRRRASRPGAESGPTAREAYRTLGVEPGADESTVKQAYRQRIKEVHPDAADGDAEEFKRVQAAYDRLTE
ncbi:MAG: J domain-containing protein [Haloarculaceae archaeon]